MDKKAIKESLRGRLPKGFIATILNKLEVKFPLKKRPSKAWVSRVCNPDNEYWDTDIIFEAVELANEEQSKLEGLGITVGAA